MMSRAELLKVIEAWFDQTADASDAGYNVVCHADLPTLADVIYVELHRRTVWPKERSGTNDPLE